MVILNFRTLTIIFFMSFTSFIKLKISSTNLTGITRRIMMGFDMRFQIRIMLFFFATSFALIHSVSRTSKIILHLLFSARKIVKTFKEYKKTLTKKLYIQGRQNRGGAGGGCPSSFSRNLPIFPEISPQKHQKSDPF